MIVGEKIDERIFVGSTTKDAYLKACKYMSQHYVGKERTEHIVHKIKKLDVCKVELTIYAEVEEQEIMDNMCSVCQQANAATYLTENKYKCEMCKIPPYKKRAKERLKRIGEYIVEEVRKDEGI